MLIILTALPCEGAPIVSKYNLKKQTEINAFQIYKNDQITLIVSGLGKTAAASAVGFIHALTNLRSHSAWLNIGIAGHSDLELGAGFIANKIIDCSTQKTYYPPITFTPSCITDQLHTVDQPDSEYHQQGGVDMEAAAFYATASRFSSGELVQCYKVVSDNKQSPVRKFQKHEVTEMVENNMRDISSLTNHLLEVSNALETVNQIPELFDKINDQVRLTHSEQLLVKARLRQIKLLNPKTSINLSEVINSSSSQKIIQHLDKIISSQSIYFQS